MVIIGGRDRSQSTALYSMIFQFRREHFSLINVLITGQQFDHSFEWILDKDHQNLHAKCNIEMDSHLPIRALDFNSNFAFGYCANAYYELSSFRVTTLVEG